MDNSFENVKISLLDVFNISSMSFEDNVCFFLILTLFGGFVGTWDVICDISLIFTMCSVSLQQVYWK